MNARVNGQPGMMKEHGSYPVKQAAIVAMNRTSGI